MKILILGATGAAGSSLLQVSLASELVEEVRTLSRRPIVGSSSRQIGFVHDSLSGYSPVGQAFANVDACFFCIGRAVSMVGGESQYRALTFSAAQTAAKELAARSPQACFHYLSGHGAQVKSRHMWARVKAEAEEYLIANHGAVCWRPGVIDAKLTQGWPLFYRVVIPTIRILAPSRKIYVTGEDLARAMLMLASSGARSRIVENPEIRNLADAYRARNNKPSAL